MKKSRDQQRKAHQEEAEAIKSKKSKLRDPPSQVSAPSAYDNLGVTYPI